MYSYMSDDILIKGISLGELDFQNVEKKKKLDFNKDLNSPELKDFVAGFYSERLLNNHWHHMLKLKHLDMKDLKSFQVDLSKNFFIF